MTALSTSHNPPGHWDTRCRDGGVLFHSQAWQGLLENAFRCRTTYAWNEPDSYAMAISTFAAGPFRIGYLGFPVGGLVGDRNVDSDILDDCMLSRDLLDCHCLRLPVSAFGDAGELPLPCITSPETAICDLQNWDISKVSKKLRRDIKRAQRAGLTLEDAFSSVVGGDLYAIYRNTVRRHNGSLRYNEQYFSALISLSDTHPDVRCTVALWEGQLAGFVVVARHKQTTYYLHGGTSAELRQHSPSDLLLYDAILWARDNGSECFNLMTSHSNQPSLIRYKEKWGAATRPHKTYTLRLRPALCTSFNIAQRAYNALRKISAN